MKWTPKGSCVEVLMGDSHMQSLREDWTWGLWPNVGVDPEGLMIERHCCYLGLFKEHNLGGGALERCKAHFVHSTCVCVSVSVCPFPLSLPHSFSLLYSHILSTIMFSLASGSKQWVEKSQGQILLNLEATINIFTFHLCQVFCYIN